MNIKKLFKSERGTHTEMRTVKRGGKTFKRKTRVGTKEKDKETIPTREEFYNQEYWYDPKRGQHPASGSGRLPTKDVATFEIKNVGGEPVIRIYNPWTKEEIYYYDLNQMDEAKARFKNLYDETFGELEMINVTKIMRGTHKEKVPVKRETGTKYEYRRVGKKTSPRTGTGKMDKFPESIKKEILDQRSSGESGAKIKEFIENLIDTMSTNDQMKMESLGLINEKNKITVTSQALTDWAHKQGVESKKKRTSAAEAEKTKHEDTKKELNRADTKISERIDTNKLKVGMIINHEDESRVKWKVIKVMKVNVYLLPEPSMPHHEPQKVRKDDLQYWVEEKIQKSEIVDIMKIMRGTHKEKVPVKRETGTKYEYRRVGKKTSPRTGTGKMDKFPESIKKEILDQRSSGESGAKIKEFIESMITQVKTGTPDQEKEIVSLNNKIISLSQKAAHKDTTQDEKKKIRDERVHVMDQEIKLRSEMGGEIKTHIDGKSTGRNLIKEGLITSGGKLTVTSQALTDWAHKQGVESKKKRTSAAEAEKTKHEDTKKELNRADTKISELEVRAKHNLDEIKLIQQSKQESDRIRQQLGKDNIDLKSKLKICLGDKK